MLSDRKLPCSSGEQGPELALFKSNVCWCQHANTYFYNNQYYSHHFFQTCMYIWTNTVCNDKTAKIFWHLLHNIYADIDLDFVCVFKHQPTVFSYRTLLTFTSSVQLKQVVVFFDFASETLIIDVATKLKN